MIGALNRRRGDRTSNRDQCSAENDAPRVDDLVFLFTRPREDPREPGARVASQILTKPIK
jgi:hypothetical protein